MIFLSFSYVRVIILCLLIFFCNTVSHLKAAHLMLQDLYHTEQNPVNFKGRSIQEWHHDLCLQEQNLKNLLPNGDETNLVVGKFVIFSKDDEEQYAEISLNSLASLTQSIVFDSAAKRDAIIKSFDGHIHFQRDPIDINLVIERTSHNFPIVPESQKVIKEKRIYMFEVLEAKRAMQESINNSTKENEKLLSLLISGNKDQLDKQKKKVDDLFNKVKKTTKAYYDAIAPLNLLIWHSEPRLFSFLKDYIRPNSLHHEQIGFIPASVTLHLHSTHNCCDNCRLQITGAIYNWLYESIVCAFGYTQSDPPIFHVIFTWRTSYNGELRNVDNKKTIDPNFFASLEDTFPNQNTFRHISEKFFITFVGLNVNNEASSLVPKLKKTNKFYEEIAKLS